MSSNIRVKRICEYCSNEFIAKTTSTRYCSSKCNKAYHRAKARVKKIEQSNTETKQVKHKPLHDIQAKEFLTVKEVSILLGCSVRSTYRLIENKTLKAVNLAERMTRINKSEVNRLLKQQEPEPIANEPKPVYVIKRPQQIQIDIKDCYNLTEIQNKYGISEKALHDIIKRNNIPKLKQGWYAYVPKKLIDELFT